jgi:hypothetical protein
MDSAASTTGSLSEESLACFDGFSGALCGVGFHSSWCMKTKALRTHEKIRVRLNGDWPEAQVVVSEKTRTAHSNHLPTVVDGKATHCL